MGEQTRKLVHIEKIEALLPIEGADRIEMAVVLGWECVVKKGEFQVGDLCAYHEIDSVCPPKPEYEFLKDTKYRVKTRKFKKQISQGLALPIGILPPKKRKVGEDITEELGVTHYDPESNLHAPHKGKPKNRFVKWLLRFSLFRKLILPKKEIGAWPVGITKTDEERVQNCKYGAILEGTKGEPFYATVKLDGQSGTYFIRKGKGFFGKPYFGVCSRNVWKKREDNSNHWDIAKKYDIQKKLKKVMGDKVLLVVQGEICGPGIQKNPEKFTELRFFVFNVIENDGVQDYHYDLQDMEEFCKETGLEMVPVFNKAMTLPEDPKEILKLAEGKSQFNPKQEREGLVFRLVEGGLKKVSFKAISNTFLLKQPD